MKCFALMLVLILGVGIAGCQSSATHGRGVAHSAREVNRYMVERGLQHYCPQHLCDTLPKFIKGYMPKYPRDLRRNGIQGAVIVDFLIDEKGLVSIEAIDGRPELFDLVIHALETRCYKPATKEGRPVAVRTREETFFTLH